MFPICFTVASPRTPQKRGPSPQTPKRQPAKRQKATFIPPELIFNKQQPSTECVRRSLLKSPKPPAPLATPAPEPPPLQAPAQQKRDECEGSYCPHIARLFAFLEESVLSVIDRD